MNTKKFNYFQCWIGIVRKILRGTSNNIIISRQPLRKSFWPKYILTTFQSGYTYLHKYLQLLSDQTFRFIGLCRVSDFYLYLKHKKNIEETKATIRVLNCSNRFSILFTAISKMWKSTLNCIPEYFILALLRKITRFWGWR